MSFFNAIWRRIASLVHPATMSSSIEPAPADEAALRAGPSATPYDALAEAIGDLVLRHDASGAVLSADGGAEAPLASRAGDLFGRGFFERVHGRRSAGFSSSDRQRPCSATRPSALRCGCGPARTAEPRRTFGRTCFRLCRVRIHRFAGRVASEQAAQSSSRWSETPRRHMTAKERSKPPPRRPRTAIPGKTGSSPMSAMNCARLSMRLSAFQKSWAAPNLAPREVAKQLEYAGIIHASAEHLLSVVNLILDMSKLEAGRFLISPEPFDFPAAHRRLLRHVAS